MPGCTRSAPSCGRRRENKTPCGVRILETLCINDAGTSTRRADDGSAGQRSGSLVRTAVTSGYHLSASSRSFQPSATNSPQLSR